MDRDESRNSATSTPSRREGVSSSEAPCNGNWVEQQRLIILADDVQINRVVLGAMLRRLGFAVLEAPDGRTALELYHTHRKSPQLTAAFLDLQMPNLDGWQTARGLREAEGVATTSGRSGHLPLVACTACPLNSALPTALDAGFDECVGKPLSFDAVRKLVSKYVPNLNGADPRAKGAPSPVSPVACAMGCSLQGG